MTIPQWLARTLLSDVEIARHCGVHSSTAWRWRHQGHVPQGAALLRLLELSGHRIKIADIPVQKRGRKRGRKSA